MGTPSSGCAPVQAPMPLPKGSSRHRQSLSISSLPLDKLGSIYCEKRTSVSALSSPVNVPLSDKEKLSLASFLGHGHAKHPDLTRRKSLSEEIYMKGIELPTEDRKPISLNPFRGHRRVGSGSDTIPCKPALEYSPRARSGSSASSPKKLDKYAVAKIAASLFHSPKKLERSMSLSRVAHRSASEVVKKVNNGPPLAVGEVILPANLTVSPVLPQKSQFTQSADVVDGGKNSSSDSDLAMDMEEPASSQVSTASSVQQHIIDITEMLEGEGAAEQPVAIAVEDPPPTIEDITSGFPLLHAQEFVNAAELEDYTHLFDGEYASPQDVLSSPSSSQSSCMASTETRIQLLSTASPPPLEPQEIGQDSPESIAALFEDATVEEDNTNDAVDDNIQLHLFATEKVSEETLIEAAVQCSLSSEEYDPTGSVSTDSEDESLPIPLTGSSEEREMNIQVPEWKSKVRKRRRSVSASGIGAVLLKVVRVSDSGPMVARRMPTVGSPELILTGVDALRARKYVLEKTAQISMGPAHNASSLISSANSTPSHVCKTESKDAVKPTYSKFVDIEIGPGGDCVELVQHSKDAQDGRGFGVASTFETRHRNQQATSGSSPRHLHDVESSTCTAHEGTLNEKFDTQTKESTLVSSASSNTSTADDRHGGRPSKLGPTSRARINSSDFDSLKECLKTANSNNSGLEQAHTTTSSSNHVAVSTRERSRTIVSRLQAPSSGTFSRVDVYRPCSVSSLANPSFSSSHQDKLWEEQAEIYSSGGRGTPGREDEPATANFIINLRNSPSPGFGIGSSADHEGNYPSATSSIPWRRTGLVESSGKKRGRPNTPLSCSMLADQRRIASPESGHFIQQIMSRIRGSNSPRASPCPKSSSQVAMAKSRNAWSSCICFSVK